MIDTHCHIDLYKNPIQIANECERDGIITIGMTNLPSHFELGYNHLLKFKKVRLALGMHPLYAEQHIGEFDKFVKNISKTSYIGEIGLDFSKEGIATKEIQIDSFIKLLNELSDKKKILSIHSRKAEKDVLKYLIEYKIKLAIFHWYSGSISLINEIINAGYFFSINPEMIKYKSGIEIIKNIPLEMILTESDGPFIQINNVAIKPSDVRLVYQYLASIHNKSLKEVENIVNNNFSKLISEIK